MSKRLEVKWPLKCGIGVALLLAATLGALGQLDKSSSEVPVAQPRIGIVDLTDPQAVAEWAAGMCRGLSVAQAASLFGVEPQLSTVVDNVAQSVPPEMRDIAADACESELTRTNNG
jgi:hypothetical protein